MVQQWYSAAPSPGSHAWLGLQVDTAERRGAFRAAAEDGQRRGRHEGPGRRHRWVEVVGEKFGQFLGKKLWISPKFRKTQEKPGFLVILEKLGGSEYVSVEKTMVSGKKNWRFLGHIQQI